MRTLEPPNRLRIGLMGILVTVLVIGVGQSFTSVPILFAKPAYYGQFTDTGGISTGDKVRIAGMDVGKVEGLKIDGDHIAMKFSIGTNTIGTESRLAIKTDTILGKKVIEIEARGDQAAAPGATLAAGAEHHALSDLRRVLRRHQGRLRLGHRHGQEVAARAVGDHRPDLPAPERRARRRGQVLRHRSASATRRSSICWPRPTRWPASSAIAASRSTGCWSTPRRCWPPSTNAASAINALLGNVAAFSEQVKGLINDNPNLNHVLEQLRTVSDILVERKDDLANGLAEVGGFLPSLNEAIASGPFFKVVLHNLAFYQIIQPLGRCRVQEAWHRPGELLAQCRAAGIPVARPQRHPVPQRCAAAGAAGAGGHPGASRTGRPTRLAVLVHAGEPGGNVTIGDEGLPRPWNPLPCAGAGIGPFGGTRLPRAGRRRDVTAEPRRAAADTGHSDRRAAG